MKSGAPQPNKNQPHAMPKNTRPYRPCVGIMLLNQDGKVWIGRRAGQPTNTSPASGKPDSASQRDDVPEVTPPWWQMPQGGIEKGEEPPTAAFRELEEETGIPATAVEIIAESQQWLTYDLPPQLLGRVWKGRYRGQKQRWFVMRFKGQDADINITPDDPKMIEFDAWRWAEVDELMDAVIPFKREVYRALLNEFAALAVPAHSAK